MTARSGDDSYYEICIALDSGDLSLSEQLSDIYISEIMDFSGEAVEIQGAKIIIRTSKDRQFIDTLLAHIVDLSANLREIWQKPIKTTNTIEKKQNRDWIAEYKRGIKPLQCGKFYIYPPWEKPLGNLFWGMQFALFSHKTALDERSSSISLVSRKNGAKPHRHYFDCDSLHESATNQTRIYNFRHCEANLRFAKAIQKNQIARSATLKALSGAGVGVVREGEGSDFAIQAPTPSLKENAHRQKGEFNADLSAESHKEIDSNLLLDSCDLDCFGDESPRNDDIFLDSSRYALKNDESFVDCHESLRDSRNDEMSQNSRKSHFAKPHRIAHFATFPLIGGESAIKDISKIALGILFSVYGRAIPLESKFKNIDLLYQMQQKGINSPQTSSVGRIFDFVAFMCGLESQSFEGESGGYVESLYNPQIQAYYGVEIHNGVISLQKIVRGIVSDYKADSRKSRTIIATKFINTLAQIITHITLENRANRPNLKVIFSGGVFANKILCDKITSEFRARKIAHHFHTEIPTNDGGIAVGQIVAYLRGDFENDFENGDIGEN